jgi:tRNA-splicing ligase RtcB (3'-phosphate/5'-hydroxy nucleic acid ligase)
MKPPIINSDDLKRIGFKEGKVLSLALKAINEQLFYLSKAHALGLLGKALQYPENFMEDGVLSSIAKIIMEEESDQASKSQKNTSSSMRAA